MQQKRKAKIVATLGPASDSPEEIRALIEAGVDVFRMNFSHGTHAEHRRRFVAIRKAEKAAGRWIGTMADLQGPKLRLGRFKEGSVVLKTGQSFRLDLSKQAGDQTRAPLPHREVFAALKPKMDLLLDDGQVRLRVRKCGPDFADTRVIIGGSLSDHKGVNVPNVELPISPLTAKDRRDMRAALDMGVDWIALSFVQRPSDLRKARRLIGNKAAILTKLEKPSAIDYLDEIVRLSDAVMVARGDLGVELPPEDVPSIQRQIIRVCRQQGKPVVVATQMLLSMVGSPTPTRAEASDVANAVYEGTDAVMLSNETAVGIYPVEAVKMMDRIISRVERDPKYQAIINAEHATPEATTADAITSAARQVAETISAAAIVTYTTSGSTTLRAARERPDVPILCLTTRKKTARQLALAWGVHSAVSVEVNDINDMVEKAQRIARAEKVAKPGDRIVVTAGIPFGTPGKTNILRIATVKKR
ncbi:pyruvate kinase [Rhodospirillaceae bacterium AH-315-P19]|nr:pyruvate kinase [Rhodospirillaceae bacterium AH-315-P19]